MKLLTRNPKGEPMCPICEQSVPQAGEFCSRACYGHFLVAVMGAENVFVDDSLLTYRQQSWYVEDNGINTPPS